MWFCYIIRCKNNSLYTGITTDLARRYQEHLDGSGSKSMRASGGPVKYELTIPVVDNIIALRLEASIKKLSKKMKESLIADQSLDNYPTLNCHLPKPSIKSTVPLKPMQGT